MVGAVRTARRNPITASAGVAGEILLTAAVLVLLYIAYTLWGTGLATQRAQDQLLDDTIRAWGPLTAGPLAQPGPGDQPATASPDPAVQAIPEEPKPRAGDGMAILRIPRLGDEWQWVVVEGVSARDLARGPGHYPDSALPGQVGNFAVAGHRSGHGAPFALLDRLRQGDEVFVDTSVGRYTYVVDRSMIVQPYDVWVVDPVPGEPNTSPAEPLITLTTCHPRWGSEQRLVVFGHLTSATPHQEGG